MPITVNETCSVTVSYLQPWSTEENQQKFLVIPPLTYPIREGPTEASLPQDRYPSELSPLSLLVDRKITMVKSSTIQLEKCWARRIWKKDLYGGRGRHQHL